VGGIHVLLYVEESMPWAWAGYSCMDLTIGENEGEDGPGERMVKRVCLHLGSSVKLKMNKLDGKDVGVMGAMRLQPGQPAR